MCSSQQLFEFRKNQLTLQVKGEGRRLLLSRYPRTNRTSGNSSIWHRDRICHLVSCWQLLWTRHTVATMEGRKDLKLSRSTTRSLYGIYRGMLPRHWPPTKPRVC